jgi:hypothetical protein
MSSKTFRRNTIPTSAELKMCLASFACEDWGRVFLRNVGGFLPNYMVSHTKGSNLNACHLFLKNGYMLNLGQLGNKVSTSELLTDWLIDWILGRMCEYRIQSGRGPRQYLVPDFETGASKNEPRMLKIWLRHSAQVVTWRYFSCMGFVWGKVRVSVKGLKENYYHTCYH